MADGDDVFAAFLVDVAAAGAATAGDGSGSSPASAGKRARGAWVPKRGWSTVTPCCGRPSRSKRAGAPAAASWAYRLGGAGWAGARESEKALAVRRLTRTHTARHAH